MHFFAAKEEPFEQGETGKREGEGDEETFVSPQSAVSFISSSLRAVQLSIRQTECGPQME